MENSMTQLHNTTTSLSEESTEFHDVYDSSGAALYTVVVVLVYTAVSVTCLIASVSFRRKRAVIQDQEAISYLKYKEQATSYLNKKEVENARRFGIRCLNSAIPMPFLLLPVQRTQDMNLLQMALAKQRLEDETKTQEDRESHTQQDNYNLSGCRLPGQRMFDGNHPIIIEESVCVDKRESSDSTGNDDNEEWTTPLIKHSGEALDGTAGNNNGEGVSDCDTLSISERYSSDERFGSSETQIITDAFMH